jgi:hypothetical protein
MHYNDLGNDTAEVTASGIIIQDASDILSLFYEVQAQTLILKKEHLHPDFFTLSSGLAGEILQKFSNYRRRAGIVGDYSGVTSKALKDFMYESNKNKQIVFAPSVEEALKILQS